MLDLKIIRQFRQKERRQFGFVSDIQKAIIQDRTRDLSMLAKRMEFVQEIKDLIYGYQNVINPEEMMLFDYYEVYETELVKLLHNEKGC